jgi:preprotein translocase subunit SecY
MFKTLSNAFKVKDVRRKMLVTLALLFVYILGTWIPIPGISASVFKSQTSNDFLGLLNSVNGGALSKGSILALGVSPYITATIVIQLLAVAIPSLERLSKQGEEGKRKIDTYSRITALILAIAQAIGIVVAFTNSDSSAISSVVFGNKICTEVFVVIVLVGGAMFTVWLGDKISEIGIGNGVSLLIYIGILSSASTALLTELENVFTSNLDSLWNILIFLAVLIVIFALIVFMDGAERRIPVQYAKQVKGRKMYGGQSTYIPIRVNSDGVMPIIFASTFIMFPQLVMSIFWPTSAAYNWYATWLGAGSWVYSVVLALLILFFTYFYSQLIGFNPDEISKQMQQNGGFITGIRAGKPTADYLKKVSNRIILFGAIFLAFLALIPTLLFKAIDNGGSTLVNAFTATGMLIIVSVALETNKQIEAQMLMKNYRGFLK